MATKLVKPQKIKSIACLKGGHHEVKETEGEDRKLWYRVCVKCGERFALLSETAIEEAGIEIVPRRTW